ncbi:MAG: thioredoxin family protein [Acidobacteria bacterium]|nr:thioredoxin family protein [Acidobacteriota bacterium]
MTLPLLSLLLAMSGQTPPPPQQPPPTVAPAVVQKAPPAPRKVYNETADAKAQISTALKAAAEDDIRVLINWGSNDDELCAKFTEARRAPEVSKQFTDHYKLVYVDVGHVDKNLDLAKSFGVTLAAGALPHLTVLDAKGRVLAQASGKGLVSDAEPVGFDAKKTVAFLTKNQAPPPPDAVATFAAALAQATRETKEVFLWFAAPW